MTSNDLSCNLSEIPFYHLVLPNLGTPQVWSHPEKLGWGKNFAVKYKEKTPGIYEPESFGLTWA